MNRSGLVVRRLIKKNDKSKHNRDGAGSDVAKVDHGASIIKDPPLPRKRPLVRLAHELKTPISAIAAAADVMRHEQLGPLGNDKYLTYASDIHASALLVLALIDRAMAQRSGDVTVAQLDRERIDTRELLSGIGSALQPLAQAAGITLNVSVVEDREGKAPLQILSDAVSLKQILYNLVNNAIKFTPAGGRVDLNAQNLPDFSVRLSVVDTGPGMSEGQIEMALAGEPVALESRQHTGTGLGIGLPLVKAMCEAIGARFTLLSERPSEGLKAQITFPRKLVIAP